eukprot:CAMPEP_0179432408 /NCGR_PEP_ID=MMETSP0799-20121207/17028_1 /TAXON_ID=46947 /ORGANISM="Geminigera cryophila, Strain CCMP2564" /LENGTH=197 /DNA_ID=CAMNT_0021209769 /DNA_START=75 /DNA_END=668 /DNA_ORIENTATION=-
MPKKKSSWFGLGKAEETAPWTPDEAMVRAKFHHYDTDNSGTLDENEVMALAQDLWMAFHPKSKPLDFVHVKELTQELMKRVDGTHGNGDGLVDFSEFLPWYTKIAENHYKFVVANLEPEPPVTITKTAPVRATRTAPPPSTPVVSAGEGPEGLLPKLQALKEQVSDIRQSLKGWDEEFEAELEKCIQQLPSMTASAV